MLTTALSYYNLQINCEAFFRCGNIIFDKVYNNSFQQRLESPQYKVSLAITEAIKGSSTEKLSQELELESIQNSWWFQKLCVFYTIIKEQSIKYLFDLILSNKNSYQTRNSQNLVIPQFKVSNSFSLYSFFSSTLVEWNKLDFDICFFPSYSIFKKYTLNHIRPCSNNIFKVSHPIKQNFLICLCIDLNHLRKHKLTIGF